MIDILVVASIIAAWLYAFFLGMGLMAEDTSPRLSLVFLVGGLYCGGFACYFTVSR